MLKYPGEGTFLWNDKKEAASEETASFFYYGSPNGIRTRVLTLRGLRPRPLVDGAFTCWLGNLDSNQDCLIQSQVCCRCTISQFNGTLVGLFSPACKKKLYRILICCQPFATCNKLFFVVALLMWP